MEGDTLQNRDGMQQAVIDPSFTIVFDTTSGISLEEQQEILEGINAMASGSRIATEADVIEAKKRGFLFPLFVNIGAIFLLVLGFVLLSLFHGQDEQDIRESSATLGHTERKLIQEIRYETNRQINEKEEEINKILSMLSEADTEYHLLQGSVESLTEDQRERAAALLQMQAEYRLTLSGLQEERAAILEDSRLREAALRSHAEERVLELSSRIDQGQADLSAAMEELKYLSAEQDRADRSEAQMGAYYAVANDQISAGRLDEASAILGSMKEFLSGRSLQGSRSLEARKQTHLAAITAMEKAVAEARRLKEAPPRENGALNTAVQDEALSELQARYTVLEQQVEAQGRLIAASSATGSEQGRIIGEYEKIISDLQTANANQQQTLNRRDSEIAELRARYADTETALEEQREENDSLLAERDELQRQNENLRSQVVDALNQALQNFQTP